MTRTGFPGAILVIEGNNDSKFYKKFVDENSCHIVVAHGKENALSSIEIINSNNMKGVLAIVDCDFWRIEGMPDIPGNVYVTDTHDSEGMIFCSDAFDRIVEEYCSENKISKYENLRDFIYEQSRPIGFLRLSSHKNQLCLVFKDLDYKKVTDKNTISVNIDTLIRHIVHLTNENLKRKSIKQKLLSDATILENYQNTFVTGQDYDSKELCCGHDIIGLFSIGLRNIFASLKAAIANKDNIGKIFRLSYDFNDFKATILAESITSWEELNPSFRILIN